jgi:hypothetical protein
MLRKVHPPVPRSEAGPPVVARPSGQAELSEKAANAGKGLIYLAATAVFLIPAVTLLLTAFALWLKDMTEILYLSVSYCRPGGSGGQCNLCFRGPEISPVVKPQADRHTRANKTGCGRCRGHQTFQPLRRSVAGTSRDDFGPAIFEHAMINFE